MSVLKKFLKNIWFPKNLHEVQWLYRVNPDLTSSLTPQKDYRSIAPGSEKLYLAPENDQISKFAYFNRDARRDYPQTVIFTQSEISKRITDGKSPESTTYTADKLPPVVNLKRKWVRSCEHFEDAKSVNPDFSIVGYRAL